jgi:hypothetical protein
LIKIHITLSEVKEQVKSLLLIERDPSFHSG